MIRYDKHKRKDGIKTQVRVVDGYRVDGKIKQKTIKDFGYLEDQENKDEFIAIVKKFDEDYKKGKLLLKKNTRKKFFEDSNSVKYNYGYKFLSAIYDSLNLDEFFSNVDFKGDYDLNSILKYFAIQRILNPSSKRHTTQIMRNLYENNIDFELADVYRSLDKFSDLNADIQKYINERIVKLIGRKFDYGFYDVTNYYCEVDFPDENGGLRQRGVSKEHRTDPIIQFGLFMDENSLPVCMSIFPGNTSDSLTFQPTMNKIKENYSLKKIIAVADKGMNSSKNIDYLVNSGNGFVFSQILKGKKGKRYHEKMFDENGYIYNSSKTFKYKTFIEDYDATDKDGNKIKRQRKVLIYWKYEDAVMAARKRDDKLDKALKSLGNNAFTIKHAYDEYIKDLYTTENGEIADTVSRSIDYDKVKEDAKFDGYFAIVTSELDYDYTKILETYSGLWRIEESFRITKSQFEARPIFVRTKKHIEGHFLICFISLLIIRMLQLKMNYSLSAERIIEALNTSTCITDSLNKVRVLKNDEILVLNESNKLTLGNQTINDLLSIINAMDAEVPYAEYTKHEFDKYLNSIVYKP
ncbi:MAG: IS1634 family transposase [Bacillales bacterium]|nr:IS1634 family transposase [Bacillales bacterium]